MFIGSKVPSELTYKRSERQRKFFEFKSIKTSALLILMKLFTLKALKFYNKQRRDDDLSKNIAQGLSFDTLSRVK